MWTFHEKFDVIFILKVRLFRIYGIWVKRENWRINNTYVKTTWVCWEVVLVVDRTELPYNVSVYEKVLDYFTTIIFTDILVRIVNSFIYLSFLELLWYEISFISSTISLFFQIARWETITTPRSRSSALYVKAQNIAIHRWNSWSMFVDIHSVILVSEWTLLKVMYMWKDIFLFLFLFSYCI